MKTSPIDSISKLDNETDFEDEEIYMERIIDEPVTKTPDTPHDEITNPKQVANGGEVKTAGVKVQQSKTDEAEKIRQAKLKGYTGDICSSCGSLTMVRNGTCLKCTTCGDTSGCS